LEAMACGCPLVLSDIPAHRELLADDTASFINPENPEEAAKAIAEVLLYGGRRTGASAAPAKAARWTVEANAREFERVYLRMLSSASDMTEIPVVTGGGCAHANES
jgi:glycosyltransferase involved in cell wall biosynthesis